jgi:hypothetical protein
VHGAIHDAACGLHRQHIMAGSSLPVRRSRDTAGDDRRNGCVVPESPAFTSGVWKRAGILAIVTLSFAVCHASSALAQRAPNPGDASTADRPLLALKQLNDDASNLFDAVRARDWTTADADLASMNEAIANLPPALPYPDVISRLRSRVRALGRAVRARQSVASLDHANATTKLATEISDQYETKVPFEIAMLSYYGRQVVIGVVSRQNSVLRQAVVDVRSTWHGIEPAVLQRGDLADARRFTDVVVQLDAARRPVDFLSAADAELAIASKLRQAFEEPAGNP